MRTSQRCGGRFRTDYDLRGVFVLARSLGKTVDELLTGQRRPLSTFEFMQWVALAAVEEEERPES